MLFRLVLFCCLPGHALAASAENRPRAETASAVEPLRNSAGSASHEADGAPIPDAVLVALIARNEVSKARELFAQTAPDKADWQFFNGRVAKAAGHLQQAEAAFREALRLRPSYFSAKRELAHTLFVAEDYDGAAHHFRGLLKADREAEYRRGYLRFLRAIERLRPLSINGHFAFVSSSNINRGSSQTEFVPGVPDVPRFDITSQAEAGLGMEAGVVVRYRHSAGEDRQIILDGGLLGREFDTDDHDNATASARLRFGKFKENTSWSIGPLVRATISADDNDSVLVGLAANYEKRVSETLTAFVSGLHQYRFALENERTNAPFTTLQVGVARPIRNGNIALGSRLVFYHPEKEHQQYFGQALFSRISRTWRGGFSADLGVEIGRRGYADDFPLAGEPRQDIFYQMTVTARHDRIRVGRFMPTINCIVGSTDSNVAFFTHSVRECTLGITTRL